MKILQVTPYFYPAWSFGGDVRVAYHTSQELAARGHEVIVFATNALDTENDFKVGSSEYLVEGVRVRYFRNLARVRGLYFAPSMIKALKKQVQDIDIIHMQEYRTFQNVIAYYFARRYRKPYVLTAHGSIPRVIARFFAKRLFDYTVGHRILNNASKLLASSRIEMKQFVDAGIPQNRIAIVPNGVEIGLFESLPEPGTFKKKFGLDDGSAMILYIGRLHERKGIDLLIEVFARLNCSNAMLVIAGPGDQYISTLKDKTARLEISDKVVFTGLISGRDKMAAYVDSEVVVYPSFYESFSLVPMEAAMCSKPVIVSDNNIMAEIVRDGGFGFSAKYGDVAQLKDRLLTVLNNPKTAEEMGRRGREFVKRNYNWRDIVSKVEIVYSDVLGTH